MKGLQLIPLLLAAVVLATGCGPGQTRVERGNEQQILHLGNGAEPQGIDPHLVTGVPEHNIIAALFEGLVSEDPKTLEPRPGTAESWEISEDRKTYTFHLREDAKWSNGNPVTAHDFVRSFERILSPGLAAEYAYMLYDVVNAEAFNTGELTDFSKVGFEAVDDRTLRITLAHPVPYFLSLLNHYSWYAVPVDAIADLGPVNERGNPWTRVENFVGNGPFDLKEWKVDQVLAVEKSPTYWDSEQVTLNEIHFYPIENSDTEERAFRGGQLHYCYKVPNSKIPVYQKENPDLLHIDPYLGVYFYRINVTQEPLNQNKVRRALALAINRENIVEHVTQGGQDPAYHFTPPETAGYTAEARIKGDLETAKALLAEAGYPDGEGFPTVEILYNTDEGHRQIAEVIQQMWKQNLNIDVTILNQEWKVFLDTTQSLNYDIARAGWIGDYQDPNTFLDMWVTDGGNNETGFSNQKYDELIAQAARTSNPEERFDLFQQAEAILMDELPVIPIYFYTRVYLLHPSVQGWYPTLQDHHPYKYLSLKPNPAEQMSMLWQD